MSKSFITTGAAVIGFVVVVGLTLAARADAGGPASISSLRGPPWVSVEYPANPHDPATRGALVMLRSYDHGVQIDAAATAHAIAVVDGERRTVPLEVVPASQGLYAVRGELPENVASVLVLSTRGGGGQGALASVLVAVDGAGHDVLAVRVPHDAREGGRWLVPREPTDREIDGMLQTAIAMEGAAKAAANVAAAGAAN